MTNNPARAYKILGMLILLAFFFPGAGLAGERRTQSGKHASGGLNQFEVVDNLAARSTTVQRPIIVIPGMFASFDEECFLKLPYLCSEDEEWRFFPVIGEMVYDSLLGSLRASGYTEENGLLMVFFYDWRLPIEDNVQKLKAAIAGVVAGAQEKTGSQQVDLIGHSMGGLLARAYVQDETYAGDVAHLVTIGSPHTGAAKAYTPWEAAYFYTPNWLEERVMGVVMKYLLKGIRLREFNPWPVLALRKFVPSGQDLLPTWDYLYESSTGAARPAGALGQQNNFLPVLNDQVYLLYDRLGEDGVLTIAGTKKRTTEKFYVNDFIWWRHLDWRVWFNWEDGEPDWGREGEFSNTENAGDGTVLVKSALLEEPAVNLIVGGADEADVVGHLEVVEDGRTLTAINSFLGLSIAPATEPPDLGQVMVLFLDGPVSASVTDPLGRSLSGAAAEVGREPIPGAEYVTFPGETFQLILIPEPLAGEYRVQVTGEADSLYSIGMLDTFDAPEQSAPNLADEWDASSSQIGPGVMANFSIPFVPGSDQVAFLAATPLIDAPVYADADVISGRTGAGAAVEIRDAADQALLGSGTAGGDGLFEIALERELEIGQRIYPRSGGVGGQPIEILPHTIYLPGVLRSP